MKKTYGVINMSSQELIDSAGETTAGSSAIEVPLLKIDGVNEDIITGGIFELPKANECEDEVLEVAYRVLGILVTKDLLAHLPKDVTAEHINSLIPFYPFSFHKRFGSTYSDRICPESTRTGKCDICRARIELFGSPEYKSGAISKDDIIKRGHFGTRQQAAFIARVYFDGDDRGTCIVPVNVTNEKSTMARRDNFFDLVNNLTSPKKLRTRETLPVDYYANGDGARWLIAEYTRAIYDSGSDGNKKGGKYPYWKLSSISPTKEIDGVGKAEDIWWPEVDGSDSIETVDVYGMINHTDPEELTKVAIESYENILAVKGPIGSSSTKSYTSGTTGNNKEIPSWEELVAMSPEELIELSVSFGGDEETLTLVAEANPKVLLRSVGKQLGVRPTPVKSVKKTNEEGEEEGNEEEGTVRDDLEEDDEDLPF